MKMKMKKKKKRKGTDIYHLAISNALASPGIQRHSSEWLPQWQEILDTAQRLPALGHRVLGGGGCKSKTQVLP